MKKRTLSLLMAASMTAGLLAGCGSSKPAETTAAPTTAAATTAAETKAEETTSWPEWITPTWTRLWISYIN